MSVRSKYYQIVSFVVTAAGAEVKASGNFNVLYERVTGVLLTISDSGYLVNSTFKKFQIDNDDVFPENFEVLLLTSGNEVPPDEKFRSFDERAKLSPYDITYVDGNAGGGGFPYTVNIYFRLENKEKSHPKTLKEFMKGIQDNFKALEGFLTKSEEKDEEEK